MKKNINEEKEEAYILSIILFITFLGLGTAIYFYTIYFMVPEFRTFNSKTNGDLIIMLIWLFIDAVIAFLFLLLLGFNIVAIYYSGYWFIRIFNFKTKVKKTSLEKNSAYLENSIQNNFDKNQILNNIYAQNGDFYYCKGLGYFLENIPNVLDQNYFWSNMDSLPNHKSTDTNFSNFEKEKLLLHAIKVNLFEIFFSLELKNFKIDWYNFDTSFNFKPIRYSYLYNEFSDRNVISIFLTIFIKVNEKWNALNFKVFFEYSEETKIIWETYAQKTHIIKDIENINPTSDLKKKNDILEKELEYYKYLNSKEDY